MIKLVSLLLLKGFTGDVFNLGNTNQNSCSKFK